MLLQLITILSLLTPALSWGAGGHEIVATIAQVHLHPTTKQHLCRILPPQAKCHLAPVAAWADQVRGRYRETGPMHYINRESARRGFERSGNPSSEARISASPSRARISASPSEARISLPERSENQRLPERSENQRLPERSEKIPEAAVGRPRISALRRRLRVRRTLLPERGIGRVRVLLLGSPRPPPCGRASLSFASSRPS
jgi:hypothetical protein